MMRIIAAIFGASLFTFSMPALAQSSCDQFDTELTETQTRDRSGSLGALRGEARAQGLNFSTCDDDYSIDFEEENRKLSDKEKKAKPAADPVWGILKPELTKPLDIDITLDDSYSAPRGDKLQTKTPDI